MDARESFRDMLRDDVGPALREHGFRGSGANWRLRNDAGDWGVVNFQKSQWGSSDEVYFYIKRAARPPRLISSEYGPSDELTEALRLVAEHADDLERDGNITAARYRSAITWAAQRARAACGPHMAT